MSGLPRFKASTPKKAREHPAKPGPEKDLDIRVNRKLLQNFIKNKRRRKAKH